MNAWGRALVVVGIVCFALPSLAGRLADLPWDDKIPQAVRSGVTYALQREASDVSGKKNEQGKNYVRVYQSAAVEPQPDGKVFGYMTIQSCLAEKMVTERWRYTLEKQGNDYRIVARDKIAASDDALIRRHEDPGAAHPFSAFTFSHDLMSLKLDGGGFFLSLVGDQPSAIHLAGAGRVTIKPLDDYEALFFQRRLGARELNDAVSEVSISFHRDDPQFLRLVGYEGKPGGPGAAPAGGAVTPGALDGLRDIAEEIDRDTKGKEFTPYVYDFPEPPEYKGRFTVRMKTAEHGWLYYTYDPTQTKEISIYAERSGNLSLSRETRRRYMGISRYLAPESRALPAVQREHRRELRQVDIIRVDGRFDIDADRFTGAVTADMNVLRDTREVYFGVGGNPTVRSVKLNETEDLMVVPYPNLGSKIYGFEETANFFRVIFPQEIQAGTPIRLTVTYDSPKLVSKISEAFWFIDRESFLPAPQAATLAEPIYMHFVVRSPAAYEHVSIGSLLNDELNDEYHYTEWGADQGFNFPTLIIGKYFKPVRKDYDGIRYTGYMTREFSKDMINATGADDAQTYLNMIPEPKPNDMEPQVLQAAAAVRAYARWYNSPYRFKDLKLVGTPAQGFSAQSPSSIVYIGENIFWPDRAVAELIKGIDVTWTHNVTAHETAHQWFGGQLSNINNDHYWFVETFAELSAAFYAQSQKDDNALRGMVAYWRNSSFNQDWRNSILDDLEFFHADPDLGPTMMRYTKGPLVFWMLKEYYGEQKLLQFLRALVQQHAGDLISTADVQEVADKVFNEKMDWFFDEYIRGIGIPQVRYKFDAPHLAEDGKGWIITGKLSQQIMVKGDPAPGKVFTHLLVPITVPTDKGPEKVKEFMDTAEKDVRIRVESKPTGALKVNDQNVVYMTVKEM